METTIKSHSVETSLHAELVKTGTALETIWEQLEASRFGFAPLLLVVMVCLGGIASACAVQISELQLMAVAVSTVFIEVLIIALAPMRTIVWATAAALLIDILVFIF